jgi:hypothetical protein
VAPHPPGHPDGSERPNCTPFQIDPRRQNDGTPCDFDIDALRTLSYQNIMAAFNQMVLGAVLDPFAPDGVNTSITKTILADTDELTFIRDWQPPAIDGSFPSLQDQLSNSTQQTYMSILARSNESTTRGPLKSALEDAFQNLTFSLLSQPLFRYKDFLPSIQKCRC